MTILCDVDGVVADLLSTWLDLYNADFGDNLTPDRITTWELRPHVKPECGGRIYEYLHRADLYDDVRPIPGAIEGVRTLRDAGHRVVFVTSCVPAMIVPKIKWLRRHGLLPSADVDPSMTNFVVCHDKSLVMGDVLIDDRPTNLRDTSAVPILFDAPHNQDVTGFVRALTWRDLTTSFAGVPA